MTPRGALREILLVLDAFVRSWALPMPEDIHAALRKMPPSPSGLFVRIAVALHSDAPPSVDKRKDREAIEDLYFYFAVHEYPILRRKILCGEPVDLDKEFPALHNLLRIISEEIPLNGIITERK